MAVRDNERPMETNLIPFLVWDEQLDTALEHIAHGNTSEGYVVLSHFVHELDTGNTPDPRANKFVVDALKEILTTHSAGEKIEFEMIFRMKSQKGRPKLLSTGSYNRALKYGGEITQLLMTGKKLYEAINETANKYKRSPKNIQEYLTRFNKIVEGKTEKPKKSKAI